MPSVAGCHHEAPVLTGEILEHSSKREPVDEIRICELDPILVAVAREMKNGITVTDGVFDCPTQELSVQHYAILARAALDFEYFVGSKSVDATIVKIIWSK